MTLFYLDPNDEPRECEAYGCENGTRYGGRGDWDSGPCATCNGTGRIGNPEARPEIAAYFDSLAQGWRWRTADRIGGGDAHPTEPHALEAARRALRPMTEHETAVTGTGDRRATERLARTVKGDTR